MNLTAKQQKELEELKNQKFELDQLVSDEEIDYSDIPALEQAELKEFVNLNNILKSLLTEANYNFILSQGNLHLILNQIIDFYRIRNKSLN